MNLDKKEKYRWRWFHWWPIPVVLLALSVVLWLIPPKTSDLPLIILVLITALYAVFTYMQAMASNRMSEEMRLQRRRQILPMVVVYLDNPVSILIELVVKNIGQGAARNVNLEISPTLFDSKNRDISELSLFKRGIHFLPPNMELRLVIDTSEKFFKDDSEYPLLYEITLSYSDIEGNYIDKQIIPLDFEVYRHLKTKRD